MYSIHSVPTYNFIYTVMVASKNVRTYARCDEFNLYWVPTCFWDAGYLISSGSSQTDVIGHVITSGLREVPQLDLDVSVEWLGNGELGIQVDIANHYYINYAPETPLVPSGDDTGVVNHSYVFTTQVTDPESDQLFYQWDWGNGQNSDWLGPFESGSPATGSYIWTSEGEYPVKVKPRDTLELEGPWSETTGITIVGKCGDTNGDGGINVGDAVFLANYIFKSVTPPYPLDRGDANCDNSVNIGDVVRLVNYVFKGAAAPGCP